MPARVEGKSDEVANVADDGQKAAVRSEKVAGSVGRPALRTVVLGPQVNSPAIAGKVIVKQPAGFVAESLMGEQVYLLRVLCGSCLQCPAEGTLITDGPSNRV
jgi:hypothetical protein